MKLRNKFSIFIGLIVILIVSSAIISVVNTFKVVHAQDNQYDLGPTIYNIHLNFKNGKVTPVIKPNDFLPYEFISDQFVDTPGLYYGKVLSMTNEQLGDFHYNLLEGDNDVLAPYFPNATAVAFYQSNTDKVPLLTISVSKTTTNINSENTNNSNSTPSNITPVNNGSNNQTQNQTVLKLYNILIIGFIILGIATIVVFVIMFIRRNRNQ